jgi:hypothetical protein
MDYLKEHSKGKKDFLRELLRKQIPMKNGYKYRKEENGTIIINNIYVGTLVFLNPFTGKVFELCDGRNSIYDIQEKIKIYYWFLDSNHLATEVLNAIRTLSNQRAICYNVT